VLRRIKVPVSESWAAVFLELRSQNEPVLIDSRRRIFVSEPQLDDLPVSAGFAAWMSKRMVADKPGRLVRVGTALVVTVMSGMAILGFLAPVSRVAVTPLREASTDLKAVAKRCLVDETAAVSKALAANSWQKLGGVGYAVVTIKCKEKSAQYRVVKNLVTGEIASVKSVG
jgi:hypothetical protein